MNITDGTDVTTDFHVPSYVEVYAFDGGVLTLWHTLKQASVSIDPIGMTGDELDRAISAGITILDRQPVNRKQRRAMN